MRKDLQNLVTGGNKSPYYQLIGMRVVEVAEGQARLVMPIEQKLFHSGGVVQGGAIASIADAATAYALNTLLEDGEAPSTVELKVNYLRPVSGGNELSARAKIAHKGKRIAVADVEVWQDDSKMVAKGMATMMITDGWRQREG